MRTTIATIAMMTHVVRALRFFSAMILSVSGTTSPPASTVPRAVGGLQQKS